MREAIAGDFIAYRGNAGRDCRVARERATPRFTASGQLASAAAGKIESTTGVPVNVSRKRQLAEFWPDARCAGYQRQPERWRPPQNQTRDHGAGRLAKPAASALAVSRSYLYQLQFLTNTPISGGDSSRGLRPTVLAIFSCVSSIISICATAK